jgi:hypothetical protein
MLYICCVYRLNEHVGNMREKESATKKNKKERDRD